MRVASKLLALALTAALQPAIAAVAPLTFEDIKSTDGEDGMLELLSRYKDDGFVFSGAAWGVVARGACGGVSSFVPYANGCSALLLASDPVEGTDLGTVSFTLNFASGFGATSFLYYSALSAATITIFEGENGTGLYKELSVSGSDCGGTRFCRWEDPLELSFTEFDVAHSIVVKGFDQTLMLDNITLNPAATIPGQLPEPGGVALAIGALGALGWTRRRAAR